MPRRRPRAEEHEPHLLLRHRRAQLCRQLRHETVLRARCLVDLYRPVPTVLHGEVHRLLRRCVRALHHAVVEELP